MCIDCVAIITAAAWLLQMSKVVADGSLKNSTARTESSTRYSSSRLTSLLPSIEVWLGFWMVEGGSYNSCHGGSQFVSTRAIGDPQPTPPPPPHCTALYTSLL